MSDTSVQARDPVPRAKKTLAVIAIGCLMIWAVVWVLFMAIRFSSFDIRMIPGIGPVMLLLLLTVFAAPFVAIGVAGAALIRQPGIPLNWLALGGAIAALVGQSALFAVTKWL